MDIQEQITRISIIRGSLNEAMHTLKRMREEYDKAQKKDEPDKKDLGGEEDGANKGTD